MPLDLSDCSTYPDGVVSDEDFALALKVIRTARHVCLGSVFDADCAVILSHAHACLVRLYEECQDDSLPTGS